MTGAAIVAPLAVGAAGAGLSTIAKAIQVLYGAAEDLNEFLDHHIAEMKDSETPVIARTGRVLEAAKYGFGLGYLTSTIVIAAGQYLLGNPWSAIVTVAKAATLTNPIAMTCAAVGAVYYGWYALSDRERNEIIERLSEGLATGIELIKSVLRFVIDKTKELLSPKNIEEIKKFIASGAAVFGRTLGDVTHRIADVVSDTFDSVKKTSGTAIDKTLEAATDAYRSVSQGASEVADHVRKRARRIPSVPPAPESFVPFEAEPDRPAPSVSQEITVVEVVTRIEPAEDPPPRK